MAGILFGLERKTSRSLAEHAGPRSPDGMQWLFMTACWDEDAVRNDLRGYVADVVGAPDSNTAMALGCCSGAEVGRGFARQRRRRHSRRQPRGGRRPGCARTEPGTPERRKVPRRVKSLMLASRPEACAIGLARRSGARGADLPRFGDRPGGHDCAADLAPGPVSPRGLTAAG